MAAIPGRGDARFSLIHARDLARIIVHAAEGEGSGIHEVSDGTPGGYGWADLLAAASAERGGPIRAVFLPRALPEAVAMAAEAVARLRGRAGMINRGKISELYQPDWVCGDSALNLADSLRFAAGLADTLAWYREAGWLPRSASADRRAGNDART